MVALLSFDCRRSVDVFGTMLLFVVGRGRQTHPCFSEYIDSYFKHRQHRGVASGNVLPPLSVISYLSTSHR